MATMITSECINCGACEPECPNTAIYQGGVEWDFNGQKHPPLTNDIFFIVPEKCTECVGFYDHEACAAVCPVDCCVPNPDIPETENVLMVRAHELHPGTEFPADFPSRFKAGNGHASTDATITQPVGTTATAPVTAAPAPVAAKPAATGAPGRIEKALSPPKPIPAKPRTEKQFAGELAMSFDEVVELTKQGRSDKPLPVKLFVALTQPLLGALPLAQKQAIERGIGDSRFFSVAGSTGLNALHNMLLYPIVLYVLDILMQGQQKKNGVPVPWRDLVFSQHMNGLLFLGVAIASLEAIWRMREGFQGKAPGDIGYRAAMYGLPLMPVFAPIVGMLKSSEREGTVGQDGFSGGGFDEKLERERRYGEVYRLHEQNNGFLLELEFPRTVPSSGIKEELGIPDEMPDYDYDLSLQNGFFVVKGKVTDPNLRRVAAVSPAFPPDFTTHIKLPGPVAGFRHRFADKTLQIALPKHV